MENTSKQLVPFCFGDNLVRVIEDEHGNPWFVAKDVALALDYEWNGKARIAHVPEEWRGVTSVVTPSGTQEMLTLSEQGLYFFLGRSDKPAALPFQKWLAGEVLPSLRKTGRYEMPRSKKRNALPDDLPDEARRIPPRMRQRIWQDAIQTARLDGGGTEDARQWFTWLCRLNGYGRSNNSNSLIVDFMDECLVEEKGARSQSSKIYEAFKNWWKLYGEEGWMPSPKTLAQFLGLRFTSMKSGVIIYRDCRIRSHAV